MRPAILTIIDGLFGIVVGLFEYRIVATANPANQIDPTLHHNEVKQVFWFIAIPIKKVVDTD